MEQVYLLFYTVKDIFILKLLSKHKAIWISYKQQFVQFDNTIRLYVVSLFIFFASCWAKVMK